MNFSKFFIDRPIFAVVLSVVILIVGGISYFQLPVSQYPEVALPTVVVRAVYTGATPETIAETVATPLEQEINGVDDMLYMESQSTADGAMTLTITFKLGTDLDEAQVLVQNRVSIALPRLPAEVRQIGVTTRKSSPDLMMVVHMVSPDDSRDTTYLANYAYLRIRDVLARLDGVGDIQFFGGSEYSMRIWLESEKLASLKLTAGDVVAALKEQNVQVAAGAIGQKPTSKQVAFELNVSAQGRLKEASEFGDIIVKSGAEGQLVRVNDVARIELGAQDYRINSYLNKDGAVAMVMFQRPGSNAIETAHEVEHTMDRLKKDFPAGVDYRIAYNPTEFVEESINEVGKTLFEAIVLVVITVFVFLQSWRTTIIPLLAIPISLVGTFAVMNLIGFSLNSLSLFGLVLAIGIVVDDAIVVVENVERLMHEGLSPRDATRKAMDEVGGALIATALVLIAVFVPTGFLPGISGQFYKQFAITIAVSTAISCFVSLTLSPALCAILLKPKSHDSKGLLGTLIENTIGRFFGGFNWLFEQAQNGYASIVGRLLRLGSLMLVVYVGLLGLTWLGFSRVPGGFIPAQDLGYLIVAAQLPDGASIERTDVVAKKIAEIALNTEGVSDAVVFAGFSGATRTNSSAAAAVFVTLTNAKERARNGRQVEVMLSELRQKMSQLQEAFVLVIQPPPIAGIGTGGGFKMQVQDRGGVGLQRLEAATQAMAMQANGVPGLTQVFSLFRTTTPRLYVDIDRTKARMLNVPINNVFDTLQVYLGSTYVNDFNLLGRTYRVTAQADARFRDEPEDIARLRTRSAIGDVVPLGSVSQVRRIAGPDRVVRFNLFPSADIQGDVIPGTSSGQSLAAMEKLAESLPPGIGYEWTDLAYQQKAAGNTAIFIFPLCVIFVFLALAAQYESWSLPLAVILIVPMCLLGAITGLWLRGMDNNILTQIGFVVLVGLACKNAILIVEVAKEEENRGKDRFAAAIEACRLRLRPIVMTSLAFILGVVPLVRAIGPGAEMRRAIGTAVFSGMLGVTVFGLLLTPVFYVLIRGISKR